MKQKRRTSYRFKLSLVFGICILFVTAVLTLTMIAQSYQYMESNLKSHLELLTEQSLLSVERETSAISLQFINQLSVKRIPNLMFEMMEGESISLMRTREITEALSMVITASSGYDSVYIRGLNGLSFANPFAEDAFIKTASELLETHGEKTYGTPVWVRTENGELYLIRDVYHQDPFRFVGKAVARLRNSSVVRLGDDKLSRQSTLFFFLHDQLVIVSGVNDTLAEKTAIEVKEGKEAQRRAFMIAEKRLGNWEAVGLLPNRVMAEMSRNVLSAGLMIGVFGMVLGIVVIFVATHSMTRQISNLVKTTDDAAAGHMSARVSVTSNDEIGYLADRFNAMMESNQELMERVVQEERKKDKAEYDALEYKYRSLQSQINPHFIYNAMEVVNAMAKLAGQKEIGEVVTHISSFFRQNTHNMEKRFITVRREFNSLGEYAYIFRQIYGNALETPFTCQPEVEDALIPTMILQPLLENALVHGVRADHAVVAIGAQKYEENLQITVKDNGTGMSEKLLSEIMENLDGENGEGKKPASGVGIRNVRNRLMLIYHNNAGFEIVSAPGKGTTVSISIPLVYAEQDLVRYTYA